LKSEKASQARSLPILGGELGKKREKKVKERSRNWGTSRPVSESEMGGGAPKKKKKHKKTPS